MIPVEDSLFQRRKRLKIWLLWSKLSLF